MWKRKPCVCVCADLNVLAFVQIVITLSSKAQKYTGLPDFVAPITAPTSHLTFLWSQAYRSVFALALCSWKSTMNWMQAIVHAWEWAQRAEPWTQWGWGTPDWADSSKQHISDWSGQQSWNVPFVALVQTNRSVQKAHSLSLWNELLRSQRSYLIHSKFID